MSPDRRACALAVLAATAVLTLGGCAGAAAQPAASTAAAVPADEVTRRIAEVDAAQQCAVTTESFADEAAITAGLDARLTAAGLTHAQWKDWHDALVDSPELVTQLAQVSDPGCPGS